MRARRVTMLSLVCAAALAACGERPAPITSGEWHAWLDSPGGELAFGLEIRGDPALPSAALINGAERLEIERVELRDRRLVLGIDRYDAFVEADLAHDGRRLDGHWEKTAGPDGKRASLGFHARVAPDAPGPPGDPTIPETIGGRWSVRFEGGDEPAVGLFEADPDGRIRGTFLTTTGDYRYLAGRFDRRDGGTLELSCFDGAHAFLFRARLLPDGSLDGEFWSRDSWHERWTARRDADVRLPDAFDLTAWVGGRKLGGLSFPDLDGRLRSLDDPAFAGRARIIEIFGSWCPNCNDASAHLAELDRRYRDRGLSILGLAFELTGDFERDAGQVRRYAEHHGLRFPLLIAGLSDKSEASDAFPLVDRIRSYPTTIFLHGDGRVRAVHQGYAGPATGPAHVDLRARFEALIEELLAEAG